MSQHPGSRRPSTRSSRPAAFSPAMLLAVVVGGMLVCSLIATSLSAIVLDSGSPPSSTQPAAADSQKFEQMLRAEIEANPDDAAALASLGNVLALRGAVEEAIAQFERAVAIDPDNAQYRRDFALTLADDGKFADAELQFQRSIALDPHDADALYFLGALYDRWQPPRPAEALAAYQRAIAAAPDSLSAAQARDAIARLEAAGRTPMASPVTIQEDAQ
ncbi:MAG: tetratricopeptide repeat protein [Thermomicrobiales bacterium]|nr:tetratricopeptide repeat protein [Thermomicrobiales bacterium]